VSPVARGREPVAGFFCKGLDIIRVAIRIDVALIVTGINPFVGGARHTLAMCR